MEYPWTTWKVRLRTGWLLEGESTPKVHALCIGAAELTSGDQADKRQPSRMRREAKDTA